jgi:ribosomal protein S18 acetylase RimI-like enzyme
MTTLHVLPVGSHDLPFLCAMLYEAAFWRPGTARPHQEDALRDPTLAVYHEGWGRPGDHGLVASVAGREAGAVWVRRFDERRHGYGFVDPDTPELTLAVAAPFRRRGIARCLLSAIIADQRLAGTAQLSLSVEDDNPARALYDEQGFVTHSAADGSRTMLRALHTGPSSFGSPVT